MREPFSGASEISVSFHLTQIARIPTDFYSQIFGGTHFPWAGELPDGARTPLFFKGASAALLMFSPLVFHCYLQVQVQPDSCFCPSYRLQCGSLSLSPHYLYLSPSLLSSFLTMWKYSEKAAVYKPGKGLSPETNYDTLV